MSILSKRLPLLAVVLTVLCVHVASAASLLVLNKEDSTLSIHDPATGASQATIPTGTGPHEVEVTADGRIAVVSNYGAQTPGTSLTVVDLAARPACWWCPMARGPMSPLRVTTSWRSST